MHGLRLIVILLFLLSCLVAVDALAEDGVTINSWLIGGGGSTRTSAANISLGGALGQGIAGRSNSGPVDLQSGFWSGEGARSSQVHTIYLPMILTDD
jgi:hypothetical protein